MKENELSKKFQQIEALIVNTNLQHLGEGVGACAFPEHDLDFIPDRSWLLSANIRQVREE